jgi:hypothetical protein
VSPSWRDEIGVHLAPKRLCLVRLRRGLRPALVAELEQPVEAKAIGHWSSALDALDQLLSASEWRGAALRVVLSDCWVRYAVVPWSPDLKSPQERFGHACQLLASLYGDAVRGWDVRLSEAPPQHARVACTAPVNLLEDVRSLCARHSVKLLSLQPQLIAAYHNWRHRLPSSGAWFVTVGAGTLAAACLGEHAWERVYTVRIGTDWPRELKRLQTFGRLAGERGGEVFIDAPLAWREVAGPAGRDLHWLESDSSAAGTLQRLERVRRLAA